MQKKYYFGLAALVIITLLVYLIVRMTNSPRRVDETETVNCGGKPVFKYKYPSDMFPVIVRDYSTKFELTSGILGSIAGDTSGNESISVDVRNNVTELREKLNQDNAIFQDILRSYFLASNAKPCDDSLQRMYLSFLSQMTDKIVEMKQFLNNVTTEVPASSGTPVNKDSVIAVIDTASGTVDTTVKKPEVKNLVILKDPNKINRAVLQIKRNYVTTGAKPRLQP